jgi:outer membrane immunogenic protein
MKLKIIIAIAALFALPGFAFAQVLTSASASNSASASSWVAGGQVGYNWQSGSWVYGLEADISAMHLNSEMNTVLPLIPAPTANANADVDWYGTVRGRLGWSTGPVCFMGPVVWPTAMSI